MRSCLLIIIFSFCFGNIEFAPHNLNVGDKGILSIHSAEINGDGNTDLIYSGKNLLTKHLGKKGSAATDPDYRLESVIFRLFQLGTPL